MISFAGAFGFLSRIARTATDLSTSDFFLAMFRLQVG